MFAYVIAQIFWMMGITAQLIASMGVGIQWIFMTFRCITFAMLDLVFFLPHVFWYLISPNIIRRVAYRSSKKTKLKNLEAFLTTQQRQRNNNNTSGCFSPEESGTFGSGLRNRFKRLPSPMANHRDVDRLDASCNNNNAVLDDETVEMLNTTINPADGSYAKALPVNLAEELSHVNMQSNSSFDDTLMVLQKINQKRQQQHEKQLKRDASLAASEASISVQQQQQAAHNPYDSDTFTDSEDEDEEDKKNLHNRATLDIYLPVPLDSLFRFMDQENKGKNYRSRGTSSKIRRKKFPIMISVNGGAWIVGCYFWNFLVARVLAARGYVVFCPDYRNFPQTTMEGMTLDVSDAIAWVLNNAERYNGDLDDVTLMGQSAGAHLTMMSLLSQAHLCAYESTGRKQGLPPPSSVAYNVARYNPRQSIHRYVGLSGIYNVRSLIRHFDRRGLYRRVLYQIAGGKDNMMRYTVNAYFDEVKRAETGEVLPRNIFDYFPQEMFFVHGDADMSAPVTESANLVFMLRNAQRDYLVEAFREDPIRAQSIKQVAIKYILVPGATHTDAIIEEPLCCRSSHVVEFLSFYHIADEQRQKGTASPVIDNKGNLITDGAAKGGSPHMRVPSMQLAGDGAPVEYPLSSPAQPIPNADDAMYPVLPASRPDGILISPMANAYRPRLLRLASYICPF